MQTYVPRQLAQQIKNSIKNYPVTALLGPRQCGKSTLAKEFLSKIKKSIYLDLEKPSDRRKLENPELYFSTQTTKIICLDEIQLQPDLFPVLRSVVDEQNRNGQFLILGSASRDLIKQGSESLAGRIDLLELTPLLLNEIQNDKINYLKLWNRGGFPRSLLARSQSDSYRWRQNFIQTFLERDIPQLGFNIPAKTLSRLWRMLAHNQGQLLNQSQLGNSMACSHTTIRSYIDLLEQTFVIRVLPPFESNLKKRLVKSPKIYLRDSGLLHALLEIENQEQLIGHPIIGASWEGFCIEQILSSTVGWRASHYRTSSQNEVDLVLQKGKKTIVVEFKISKSPKLSKGFWQIIKDIQPNESWVICPVDESYPIEKNVFVGDVTSLIKRL
jgi:uncharacterized protein